MLINWKRGTALFGCICMIVLSACGSRPQIETDTEADFNETAVSQTVETAESTEQTAASSEELSTVETEESAEPDTQPSETESQSAEIPDVTISVPSVVEPTYEVMDSIYEEISLSWADACMLVLDCVLTTPVDYPGEPVFAAMYCEGEEEPLVISGHQTGDLAGNYYIYSFVSGRRIYQLGNYVGIFYWNQEADRLCLQTSGTEFHIYAYRENHMILLDTVPTLPEGYTVIPMNPLNVSPPVTVDNLNSYIVSL